MGRNRKLTLWDHFTPMDKDERPVTSVWDAVMAKCVHCDDWLQLANSTRMRTHYERKHAHDEGLQDGDMGENFGDPSCVSPSLVVEVEPYVGVPPKRQKTLDDYIDRKFSPTEQENAELAQAFALVMSGHSYNCLDQVGLPSRRIGTPCDFNRCGPRTF